MKVAKMSAFRAGREGIGAIPAYSDGGESQDPAGSLAPLVSALPAFAQ